MKQVPSNRELMELVSDRGPLHVIAQEAGSGYFVWEVATPEEADKVYTRLIEEPGRNPTLWGPAECDDLVKTGFRLQEEKIRLREETRRNDQKIKATAMSMVRLGLAATRIAEILGVHRNTIALWQESTGTRKVDLPVEGGAQ